MCVDERQKSPSMTSFPILIGLLCNGLWQKDHPHLVAIAGVDAAVVADWRPIRHTILRRCFCHENRPPPFCFPSSFTAPARPMTRAVYSNSTRSIVAADLDEDAALRAEAHPGVRRQSHAQKTPR